MRAIGAMWGLRVDEWTGGRVHEGSSGRVDEWTSGRVDECTRVRVDEWTSGRVHEGSSERGMGEEDTRPLAHSCPRPLAHSLARSLVTSFTRSLAPSPTRSLAHRTLPFPVSPGRRGHQKIAAVSLCPSTPVRPPGRTNPMMSYSLQAVSSSALNMKSSFHPGPNFSLKKYSPFTG